ncbi:hypothetical protein SAMN04488503_1712 [Humidesulfovibrio mexicanus]|jgi:hypothetical protein|uniref:Uncharacterized protein n=1 Tax=Humidesulfovibrio mexicanus TaxID=147047 RepID=A0A239A059_9BACT|nr:hypothetical protein [Humidesulfovibrio mexicanus]SNR88498.1 hypothetical protein SAMN04488503_1712 [Humidesulfovibrio mexicanus]
MFLDAELKELAQAKARLAVQADLRRQVIQLELLALRSRARRSLTSLSLGFGLAGKVLDFLAARRRRRGA